MIRLENIRKSYGGKAVLAGVNLEVRDGEMLAIIGESGNGKTTLLNIMAGIENHEGRYYFNEQLVSSYSRREKEMFRREHVGMVFQNFQLLEDMNCRDNIFLSLAYGRKKIGRGRLSEILESIGMTGFEKRDVRSLSGGEKQRIAIGRCLFGDNELILADEPTGALDEKNGKKIIVLLKKMCLNGRTVIIVTHDEKVAEKCDRIVKLENGMVHQIVP